MIEPKQDYRAVIKSPDGDVAETTGPCLTSLAAVLPLPCTPGKPVHLPG